MPIYKTITFNAATTIYVWYITESEAWLRSGLTLKDASIKRLFTMSSELHRRGFLSIRHLLRTAGYTDQNLFYDDFGKPFLDDGKYISITHSYEFTAIIISDNPVGIDIEKQREKIVRIAPKFIGFEEIYMQDLDAPVKELTVVWGAKESMYKLYGKKGLGFKEHCMVAPFFMSQGAAVARIVYEGDNLKFDVFFEEMEDFMLVYILPSQNA